MMESFSMELRCWPRQHAPLEDNEGITSCVLHQLQQTRVQCSKVLQDKVQFVSVKYSAVQYIIGQCSVVQCFFVQCSIVQCSVSVSCIHYSGSRSAIMIYSPSHPHTTHNMPTHTFILFRTHGYTCMCRNTRVPNVYYTCVQSTSSQLIHLFFFAHPSTPIPLSLTIDRTRHFVI